MDVLGNGFLFIGSGKARVCWRDLLSASPFNEGVMSRFVPHFVLSVLGVACFSVASAQELKPGPTDARGDPLPPYAQSRLGSERFRTPVRDGHGAGILSFSRDGRWLACASDKGVEFWDLASGAS